MNTNAGLHKSNMKSSDSQKEMIVIGRKWDSLKMIYGKNN